MIKDIQCPNCDNVVQYAKVCQYCGCGLPENFTPDISAYPQNMTVGTAAHIDPRVERQLVRCRHEIYRPASGSTREGEIPVIMAVESGRSLPGSAREMLRIPPLSSDQAGYDLVTARIALNDIIKLDESCIVKYPSTARTFTSTGFDGPPYPKKGIPEEIGLNITPPMARGPAAKSPKKVVVGVIDFGLDFAHRHFIRNGKTRITALWNQAGTAKNANSSAVKYGTLYRAADIDRALLTDDPYQTLGYGPPADSLYDTGAHGTYVTDVAAGNGFAGQGAGFAPDAEIIFVDLARSASHNFVGSRYGDSAHLLEAVMFIIDEADRAQASCVINLSIGSNDGPHDGSTLVEIGIDRLIAQKKHGNCAVVIASGNWGDQQLYASGNVKPGSILDLFWYVPPYDMTSNEIEIWYPAGANLSIQVLDPDNAPLCDPVRGGEYAEVRLGSGGCMLVFNRKCDRVTEVFNPGNKQGTIYVYYERCDGYLKKGRWKLRLGNDSKSGDIRFEAWIERDERGQSVFIPSDGLYQVSGDNTLNSIANGKNTIAVGAYDQNSSLMDVLASTGFALQSGKPDILAPGKNILAARSRTSVLRYRQTGTSMSAAVVTGVIAWIMAQIDGAGFDQVRTSLIKTAKQSKAKKAGKVFPGRYLDPSGAINDLKKLGKRE